MFTEIIATLGLGQPLGRGVIFAVATLAGIMVLEPSLAYAEVVDEEDDENIFTVSKPFTLFASEEEKPYSTYFPWYFYPIFAFLLGFLFI